MAFVARNGVWLTRANAPVADGGLVTPSIASTSPLTPDGLAQAIASGELRMTSGSNMLLYSRESSVLLGAQGIQDVLTVAPNLVQINGDLRVVGRLDAVSTTDLLVQDKVVRVSVPNPTGTPVAEAVLDQSGLALADGAYTKSLLWRTGVGAGAGASPALANTDADSANLLVLPRWHLSGGALNMTVRARANAALASAGGTLGYGFNMNSREELEIYKNWTDSAAGAASPQLLRLLCIGSRTTAATFPSAPVTIGCSPEDILLPTRPNPYA